MGSGGNPGQQEGMRPFAIFGKVERVCKPNVGTGGEPDRGGSCRHLLRTIPRMSGTGTSTGTGTSCSHRTRA